MKLIPKDKCRIGMLMVDGRPYQISAINQFIDQIRNGVQGVYTKRIYTISSFDEAVIKECVENLIIRDEVDVLYTTGRTCTLYANEVAKQHGNFPILFSGILDPVAEGIVGSLEAPGGNITGTMFEPGSAEDLAAGIAAFYPDITRVLVPYSSIYKSNILKKQAYELREKLSAIGMEVIIEPIGHDYDQLMSLIEKYREAVDCFVLLDGCFSSVAQKPIAYTAWEECITQIGCCNSSLESGAAASYAGDLNPLAAGSYQQLETARLQQIPLGKLPVNVIPNNREFTVNADILRRIGYSVESLERIFNTEGIRVIRQWVSSPQNN